MANTVYPSAAPDIAQAGASSRPGPGVRSRNRPGFVPFTHQVLQPEDSGRCIQARGFLQPPGQ